MDDLNALVRRLDEDRWLAAQFGDAALRERLAALYAVNYEIAHVGESVREPAIGAIRLAWWGDALGEIAEGKPPRAHPALAGFARAKLTPECARGLQQIAIARAADLDAAPFAQWSDLERYLDATAGALIKLAIKMCSPGLHADAFGEAAGRAWGYVGMARAEPFWRARGRSAFPGDGSGGDEALRRAEAAYVTAKGLARALPTRAFPACGYAALVPAYLRTPPGRVPGLFERQVRLVAASASGRL